MNEENKMPGVSDNKREMIPGGDDSASKPANSQSKASEPFAADKKDGIFAVAVFVIGYLFSRWVLFSWQGWGVAAFTALYCVSTAFYFLKKNIKLMQEGWFWLAVTLLTGISFALWTGNEIEPWRSFLLFASAVYWVIAATGTQLLGKTSNLVFFDAINAFFVIPFYNFFSQYKALASFKSEDKAARKKVFSVVLGVALGLVVISVTFPLLLEADSGGFLKMARFADDYFNQGFDLIARILEYFIPAVPAAAYIYGLIAGSTRKRGCGFIKPETVSKASDGARILPPATAYTLLGLVCGLYIVFVGSQIPYFFSAFTGRLPDGWRIYSEYARRGFFELFGIAVINLSLMTGTNLLLNSRGKKQTTMVIFNIILSMLTLILIAAAFSKMALYIQTYGLSMKRLLPCIFMGLLAMVYIGAIVMQKVRFSVVRTAVMTGAAVLCLLCLIDPDGLVVRYNAERYISGTLESFDKNILYRAGPAGVKPAIEVYKKTADIVVKNELRQYLTEQNSAAIQERMHSTDNVQKAFARVDLAEFFKDID